MLLSRLGDWGRLAETLEKAPRKILEARTKAILQEGEFLRARMVEGIREQAPGGQAFKALSPGTLLTRRLRGFKGKKALIVHADLRNSIRVKLAGDEVFIGIVKSAKSPDGKSMIDIAEVHELGSKPIVRKLTKKMQRFLALAYRKAGLPYVPGAGTGVIVSKVAARPFIRPVLEKYTSGGQVKDRLQKRMAKLLVGTLGTVTVD